jgi:hypothetical protein
MANQCIAQKGVMMNDFTKEELKELLASLWDRIYGIEFMVEPNPLIHKIQSLIDNYCDHEWICWDDEYNTRDCLKCGEECQGEIKDECHYSMPKSISLSGNAATGTIPSNLTNMDYTINGFSIKDTILETIENHLHINMEICEYLEVYPEMLAQEITDAIATKLRYI